MNQDFLDFVTSNIKDYLPSRFKDAEIATNHVLKSNNRDLTSVYVRTGEKNKSVGQVYLNDYEDRYLEGESLVEIMEEIAQILSVADLHYLNAFSVEVEEDLRNYESVKPKLAIRLTGLKESREFLRKIPYTPFGNLAITYRVVNYDDNDILSSYVVENTILEEWGITKEELHRDALKSQTERSPVVLVRTKDIYDTNFERIMRLNLYNRKGKLRDRRSLYTLTNERYTNGACVIVQDGVLERVAKLLDNSFYILPSSIHEVMIAPATNRLTLKDCNRIVRNANKEVVTIDEKLSDKAMFYDRHRKKLIFN